MTMSRSSLLSCPVGSSCHGKLRRITSARIRVLPVRIGWKRDHRPQVLKVWSKEIAPSGNEPSSWLGGFLRRHREGDSQKTAVVDVHLRFSLLKPQNLVDSLAPRWFKGVQALLPYLVQHGGGGNRDGDFSVRLGYGGDDDDSRGNADRKKRLRGFYARWAAGVASVSLLVWALGQYSGIPQRTAQSTVSQFVDCVVWLGLVWCLAAVFLWAARMLVSLTPKLHLRSRNAFSTGRDLVVRSKLDEWMAQNVVAVPGLVVTLFLVSDVVHYATSIFNLSSGVSRSSREKKGRRGSSSRRRP